MYWPTLAGSVMSWRSNTVVMGKTMSANRQSRSNQGAATTNVFRFGLR